MNKKDEIKYDPIVRIKWVANYLDVDQSTIFRWRHSKNSNFPEPLQLGSNSNSTSIGWRRSKIESYLQKKEDNISKGEIEE